MKPPKSGNCRTTNDSDNQNLIKLSDLTSIFKKEKISLIEVLKLKVHQTLNENYSELQVSA